MHNNSESFLSRLQFFCKILHMFVCCPGYTQPDLNTCRVAVINSQGENTNSTNSGGRTDCSSQQDAGIKTQPTQLFFVIKADFNQTYGTDSAPYVSETKIGIVGAKIVAVKVALDGE